MSNAAIDAINPESWPINSPIDAFGELEQLITSAQDDKILDSLPLDADEAIDSNYELRASVISERLWLLGYLNTSKDEARNLFTHNRNEFLRAVKHFQEDCDLEPDSWTGKLTWAALQGLISFEGANDFTLSPRGDGSYNLASKRAFQLRLNVLGLSPNRPEKDFSSVSLNALEDFQNILKSFKLLEFNHEQTKDFLDPLTVKFLLDHDSIINRVADLAVPSENGQLSYRFYRDAQWNLKSHMKKIQKFMVQLAKIELWLLGSDISIESTMDYPVLHFDGKNPLRFPEKNELGLALVDFYMGLTGRTRAESIQLSKTIRPEFFKEIQAQGNQGKLDETLTDSDATTAVLERLTQQSDIEQALTQGRSLGMKLWDGVKRIWNWFKNKVSAIIDFGKNIIRAFYRYATKGFQILKRAVVACIDAIDTWATGSIIHPANNTGVQISKDLDMHVVLGEGVSSDNNAWVGKRLKLYSTRFQFAARILAFVIDVLVSAPFQRWARFARALVSCLREIMPLYRELQIAEEAIALLA